MRFFSYPNALCVAGGTMGANSSLAISA